MERIKSTQYIFDNLVELFYSKLITTYGRAEVGKRDIQLLKYKEFLNDLEIEIFDFIREDVEFKRIIEQLNRVKQKRHFNYA